MWQIDKNLNARMPSATDNFTSSHLSKTCQNKFKSWIIAKKLNNFIKSEISWQSKNSVTFYSCVSLIFSRSEIYLSLTTRVTNWHGTSIFAVNLCCLFFFSDSGNYKKKKWSESYAESSEKMKVAFSWIKVRFQKFTLEKKAWSIKDK